MTSRTLTVFLVDLKGYTSRTASSSRSEITDLLRSYRRLITPIVDRYGGHIIKEIGDAFLIAFESPTNAVSAGAFLQDFLRRRNQSSSERERIEVRVAIHSGEVEELDGDIFGDTVNTAYRIENVTEIGEVYFTEPVFLTMNRNEIPSCEVGQRMLKGLPQPVQLYRLLQDPADNRYRRLLDHAPPTGRLVAVRRRRRRRLSLGALALAAIAAAAALVFLLVPRGDPAVAEARALVERAQYAEAVEALGRSFAKRIPPPKALRLVEEAASCAIDARLAARDFADARTLAWKWSERWVSLRELPTRVALAESAQLVRNERAYDAVVTLRTAIEKGADTWPLHLALSRLYARRSLHVQGRRSGIYIESVDEIEKALTGWPAEQPLSDEIKTELWKRFAAQPRAQGEVLDSRARKLCTLVHRHLWPEYRKKLLAGCGSDEDPLRLNSHTVLEKAGALEEADLLAYHARNVTYHYWAAKQDEAIEFLVARTDPKKRAQALATFRTAAEKLAPKTDSSSRETLEKIRSALARMEKTPTEGAPANGGR